MGETIQFAFDDQDLDFLFQPVPPAPSPSAPAAIAVDSPQPTEELHQLARRIAAQYVDVLSRFASMAYAGQAGAAGFEQLRAAITSIQRLAIASQDEPLQSVLADLATLTREIPANKRSREAFLRGMREQILRFAELLPPHEAERLRSLLLYQRGAHPLLDELAGLPGIGRKRLERLYCAGLFTVEAVGAADAREIAEVTGLPRPLAQAVVDATQQYVVRERSRCVLEIQDRAMKLEQVMVAAPMDRDAYRELVLAARQALSALSEALRRLDRHETELL